MQKSIVLAILVLATTRVSARGQNPEANGNSLSTSHGLQFIPASQFLTEKHIGLDLQSLRSALSNPDPEIRGVAAMELAGNKDKEAVPFIVEGVKKETDPAARLRMAASLYQLSPNDGQAFMVGLCQEKVGKRSIAINAAQTLTLLDKSGKAATDCLPNLMSILNDSTDPASQAGALSVLGAIARTLPDSTRDSVRAVAIRYSTSKDFELMVAAIRALASDKNSQSLDALRHAAQVETIPGRRDYILNQLQLASR